MFLVEYSPTAKAEYNSSILWYKERSERAAENFIDEIEKTVASIKINPSQFKNIRENYFEAVVQKFPFSIVFTIEEKDLILVVAIFHQSRNPIRKYRKRKS